MGAVLPRVFRIFDGVDFERISRSLSSRAVSRSAVDSEDFVAVSSVAIAPPVGRVISTKRARRSKEIVALGFRILSDFLFTGFLSARRRLATGRASGEISRLFNLVETITSGLATSILAHLFPFFRGV